MFEDHFESVQWSADEIRSTVAAHTTALLRSILNEYEPLPRQVAKGLIHQSRKASYTSSVRSHTPVSFVYEMLPRQQHEEFAQDGALTQDGC